MKGVVIAANHRRVLARVSGGSLQYGGDRMKDAVMHFKGIVTLWVILKRERGLWKFNRSPVL